MSDLTNIVAPTPPSPGVSMSQSGIRLGIGHLLLWTMGVAFCLAAYKPYFDTLAAVSRPGTKMFEGVRHQDRVAKAIYFAVASTWQGAAIAWVVFLPIHCILRGIAHPIPPGHWLLLRAGLIHLPYMLVFWLNPPLMANVFPSPEFTNAMMFCTGMASITYFAVTYAAWRFSPLESAWRGTFQLEFYSLLPLVMAICFWPLGIVAIGLALIGEVCVLINTMHEWESGVKRDVFHYVGLIVELLSLIQLVVTIFNID